MKSEIKLKSRDGTDNRLIQTEEPNKFKLKTDYDYWVSITNEDTGECKFIDPSGGPLITIGSEIEGHKVQTIYSNGIIEFES